MSLATFKKKSINKSSSATKRSGKPPGGFFLPQGPFGNRGLNYTILQEAIKNYGAVGFSLEGAFRSISVGKDMKFSQQGTRYRGPYAYGNGGKFGRYYQAEPVLNAGVGIIAVKGNQWEVVKPSVLSNRGMLQQKYRWAYSGQYPNYWVQPNYTGNQTDSASQGLYVHTKSAQNDCVVDVNNRETYVGYYKKCGPTDCQTTPARGYKMNILQSNAPYTKNLGIPQDSSQHTLHIQRRCSDPFPRQKPFPYRTYGGTGILRGGTNVNNVASGCNTSPNFVAPPDWYIAPRRQNEIIVDVENINAKLNVAVLNN
jgi:hypothetical protein